MATEHRPPPPDLTQEEVDRICEPLTQHAAQVRYLREVRKLIVNTTPGGAPLVNRRHYDEVSCGRPLAPGEASRGEASNDAKPAGANITALEGWGRNRKARHGKT